MELVDGNLLIHSPTSSVSGYSPLLLYNAKFDTG
jgi:hypothetical protein